MWSQQEFWEQIFPSPAARKLSQYLFEPSPTALLIQEADTKCLDKARFCFNVKGLKYPFQISMCLRCGNYIEGYIQNDDYSNRVICNCERGPKEDIMGNTLMELLLKR